MIALLAAAAVLAVETVVLQPFLDARVLDIMAGRDVGASIVHDVYIGLDILKLALIFTAAIASARWIPLPARA
jgi:hypothetical protein